MTITNHQYTVVMPQQQLGLDKDATRKATDDDDDDGEKQGLLLPVTTEGAIPIDMTTTTTTATTLTSTVNTELPVWSKHVAEIKNELSRILFLSLPTALTQVCLYSLFPLATSSVGRHLSSGELAGFGLGALMGNFTCLSVIMGALSAAETLMPRAYAAHRYSQLGVVVARSVVVCAVLLLSPMVLLSQPQWTASLLITWGTEPPVAIYASNWMRQYAIGIPGMMLFRAIQCFCVTQDHPWPPVQASILVTFVLHPYLLHHWVHRHGLLGSAWAIVFSQYAMLAVLLGILAVLKRRNEAFHVDSWPRLASTEFWAEVVQWKPLWACFSLGLGGVVSKSEWW